jgi:hypothetical protein
MAFINLFLLYSNKNETQSVSYANMDENSIAETLLDELESQCQNSLTLISLQTKRNSQTINESTTETILSTYNSSINIMPTKRHSSVDYSWLTPNRNLLQSANELYHLSDIIKMELSELIRNVLAEDCTLIINQFRRHIRAQSKSSTPENIIALFRTTISDYIDQKAKNRANINNTNEPTNSNTKTSTGIYSFVRNNRINPKHQLDDEQHCIAELTEISITSSSNDGTDNNRPRSNSQT